MSHLKGQLLLSAICQRPWRNSGPLQLRAAMMIKKKKKKQKPDPGHKKLMLEQLLIWPSEE